MLFASDCTKELTETNIRRLLSLETKGKRRKRSIGIFHFLYLCCHSRIFLVFSRSCTNKSFTRGPAMNLGPLDRIFLQSCILFRLNFLTRDLSMRPSINTTASSRRSARSVGTRLRCALKSRVTLSASQKRVSNPTQKTCEPQAYVPRYVRVLYTYMYLIVDIWQRYNKCTLLYPSKKGDLVTTTTM